MGARVRALVEHFKGCQQGITFAMSVQPGCPIPEDATNLLWSISSVLANLSTEQTNIPVFVELGMPNALIVLCKKLHDHRLMSNALLTLDCLLKGQQFKADSEWQGLVDLCLKSYRDRHTNTHPQIVRILLRAFEKPTE